MELTLNAQSRWIRGVWKFPRGMGLTSQIRQEIVQF